MANNIAFYIEVRVKNKWRPLILKTPMELVTCEYKKKKGRSWYVNSCCLSCKDNQFRDFLSYHTLNDLPNDISPEMKDELSKYEKKKGYFMYSSLVCYNYGKEKQMLCSMLKSRDYRVTMLLYRIEKYFQQKPIKQEGNDYVCSNEDRSIEEIYEDFQNENGDLLNLRYAVQRFLSAAEIDADENDVRILFGMS